MREPHAIECVDDPSRAGVLLAPLRAEIAHQLASPASATEVADRLGLPRQKVNYHVRQLADAGFLRRAGQRRKRNMIEQRWVATARSYLLTPEVVPPLQPRTQSISDRLSADYLLALAGQIESELGTARREADRQGKRLSTLSIDGEIAFESAGQRAAFTQALQQAVTAVVREFSTAPGRPKSRQFRLVVGCYPLAAGAESTARDLPNEHPPNRGERE
jgi:DNA-binding transcriptional ArsR family regulator